MDSVPNDKISDFNKAFADNRSNMTKWRDLDTNFNYFVIFTLLSSNAMAKSKTFEG